MTALELIVPTKRLPSTRLRLAIATAIVDGVKRDEIADKLFREDGQVVLEVYDDVLKSRLSGLWSLNGRLNSYFRSREKVAHRKQLTRRKTGLRIPDFSRLVGISKATLVALLEHCGVIELVQYGLDQKRRLVTDTAFLAGLGHNARPTNRLRIEGANRTATFPLLYEDRLEDLMWMMDYAGIKDHVAAMQDKKPRLAWLLTNHPYLPEQELADLSGYTRMGVRSARIRHLGRDLSATDPLCLLSKVSTFQVPSCV